MNPKNTEGKTSDQNERLAAKMKEILSDEQSCRLLNGYYAMIDKVRVLNDEIKKLDWEKSGVEYRLRDKHKLTQFEDWILLFYCFKESPEVKEAILKSCDKKVQDNMLSLSDVSTRLTSMEFSISQILEEQKKKTR